MVIVLYFICPIFLSNISLWDVSKKLSTLKSQKHRICKFPKFYIIVQLGGDKGFWGVRILSPNPIFWLLWLFHRHLPHEVTDPLVTGRSVLCLNWFSHHLCTRTKMHAHRDTMIYLTLSPMIWWSHYLPHTIFFHHKIIHSHKSPLYIGWKFEFKSN